MAQVVPSSKEIDLDRIAEEEILREAKRAVARSEINGIGGFKKCPLPQTNKRFLVNTIVNNIKSNQIKEGSKNKKLKKLPTSSSPVDLDKNKRKEKDSRKNKKSSRDYK